MHDPHGGVDGGERAVATNYVSMVGVDDGPTITAAAKAAAAQYSRRGWSAMVDEFTARLDVLGSSLFLVGSVLFYPSIEQSCSPNCQTPAAALFVVGSLLFWVGAAVALHRARRTRARAAFASRANRRSDGGWRTQLGALTNGVTSAHADAMLSFVADGMFTVGSIYFFPCVREAKLLQPSQRLDAFHAAAATSAVRHPAAAHPPPPRALAPLPAPPLTRSVARRDSELPGVWCFTLGCVC